MENSVKKNLSLLAFVLVTFYCMMTNYWILWAGITLMLFTDNTLDSVKEWIEKRDEKYMARLNAGSSFDSEYHESMILLQQSVVRIERRLDSIEKNTR